MQNSNPKAWWKYTLDYKYSLSSSSCMSIILCLPDCFVVVFVYYDMRVGINVISLFVGKSAPFAYILPLPPLVVSVV